jgi:DNA-binding phage protein
MSKKKQERVTVIKMTCKTGRLRFIGMADAAAKLGVKRQHLHKVLTGQRDSRRIMARLTILEG